MLKRLLVILAAVAMLGVACGNSADTEAESEDSAGTSTTVEAVEATVVQTDIKASNGVIHVTDLVLLPPLVQPLEGLDLPSPGPRPVALRQHRDPFGFRHARIRP